MSALAEPIAPADLAAVAVWAPENDNVRGPSSGAPTARSEKAIGLDLDRRFRRQLIGFFRRRGCCRETAEDLTQDTFLRFFAYSRLHTVLHADGLIFQIASNLLCDAARAARPATLPLFSPSLTGAEPQPLAIVDEITPERILLARENIQRMVSALRELDERTQAVFLMHRIQKRGQRDIAEAVGVSVSLVEKIIRNAQRHLAKRAGQRSTLTCAYATGGGMDILREEAGFE